MGHASSQDRRQYAPFVWRKVEILNATAAESEIAGAAPKGLEEASAELETLMRPIVDQFVHDNLVDYDGIKTSEAYAEYRKFATTVLPSVQLSVSNETAARAFFINLYNMLTIDAMCQNGVPPDGSARLHRWTTASYRIGGHVFSLNDIENGVLRGNKKSAVPGTKITFRKKDPKAAFVVPLDRRIHFALNCGALSCPPVRTYTAAYVDDELTQSSKDYLAKYLRVLPEQKKVKLTRLALWFATDFGAGDRDILNNVKPFAQDEALQALEGLLSSEDRLAVEHFPYSMEYNGTSEQEKAAEVENERVQFWEAE